MLQFNIEIVSEFKGEDMQVFHLHYRFLDGTYEMVNSYCTIVVDADGTDTFLEGSRVHTLNLDAPLDRAIAEYLAETA